MADPAMLAAVTAAVKGEDPPAQAAPVADPPASEPAADPPAAAAVAADLIGDPPEPAAAEPVADAQGRVRGPDGKFVAKAADAPADPAVTPPAAPVAAAAPATPPKAADPVNDPIPPQLKAETRERMTALVETVKAKDAEVTAARQDFDLLMAPINEAGATFDQFQEAMQLLKYINSPHQHEQMQALQYLQGAGSALAERLGQVPPGADPLAGQADLLQAVQANQMPRAYAEEVAKARRLTAATTQHQQTSLQRSQQEQAKTREVQEGQAAVREVEQTLEATDPQYKVKIEVLRTDMAFVNSLRTVPPKQWAAKFAEKYRAIKVAVPPVAATPAAAAPGAPSPLRAKQPAGTAARPPANMLEAVRGAVGAGAR